MSYMVFGNAIGMALNIAIFGKDGQELMGKVLKMMLTWLMLQIAQEDVRTFRSVLVRNVYMSVRKTSQLTFYYESVFVLV